MPHLIAQKERISVPGKTPKVSSHSSPIAIEFVSLASNFYQHPSHQFVVVGHSYEQPKLGAHQLTTIFDILTLVDA